MDTLAHPYGLCLISRRSYAEQAQKQKEKLHDKKHGSSFMEVYLIIQTDFS